MLNKKLAILTVLVMIAPLVLAACGPTAGAAGHQGDECRRRDGGGRSKTPIEVTSIVERVVTATPEPSRRPTQPPAVVAHLQRTRHLRGRHRRR